MDAVKTTHLSDAARAAMVRMVKELISPDGTVLKQHQWNATVKKICARLLSLQCQRTGNLAYLTRQAFKEKTVETVDGELMVCVSISKHKVSRFKKAFLTMSVADYQDLVMPFVIAAGRRAKAAHRDCDNEFVFVTSEGHPVRKASFVYTDVNLGREHKIAGNIIRHCSTALVVQGRVPGVTLEGHCRVLLHDPAVALKKYVDLTKKDTMADIAKYGAGIMSPRLGQASTSRTDSPTEASSAGQSRCQRRR